jgi:hypothetical protein
MYFSWHRPPEFPQDHTVRISHRHTTKKSFAIPPTTHSLVNYRIFSPCLPPFVLNDYLPLPPLPTRGGKLICKYFLNDVICRRCDDISSARMWGRSGGRCLQVARPSGSRKRSRSIAIESESPIVFFVHHATDDHPPLPAAGYFLD